LHKACGACIVSDAALGVRGFFREQHKLSVEVKGG
jgi:hypothetical protein